MTTVFRNTIMRTALLAICTTALSTMPMMAQDPSTPAQQQDQAGPQGGGRRGGGEHQVEMLTKRLNLTPDQVTKVKAIDDDSKTQMMAVRNDSSVQGPDKRSKMMDIRKASQDKIRAVLTDDQKPKYDEMLAKMRERRAGGEGAPAATPQ
jgi:protein CpxP